MIVVRLETWERARMRRRGTYITVSVSYIAVYVQWSTSKALRQIPYELEVLLHRRIPQKDLPHPRKGL
jgi:hypothetical protein